MSSKLNQRAINHAGQARLRSALAGFSEIDLSLVLAYYAGEGGLRSSQRQAFCEALNLSPPALREHAGRLRMQLAAVLASYDTAPLCLTTTGVC